MDTTTFDGITFVEGRPSGALVVKPIRVDIGGVLTSAQLKDLDDVKRTMADRARSARQRDRRLQVWAEVGRLLEILDRSR